MVTRFIFDFCDGLSQVHGVIVNKMAIILMKPAQQVVNKPMKLNQKLRFCGNNPTGLFTRVHIVRGGELDSKNIM